jgi:hypothetical protein
MYVFGGSDGTELKADVHRYNTVACINSDVNVSAPGCRAEELATAWLRWCRLDVARGQWDIVSCTGASPYSGPLTTMYACTNAISKRPVCK